LVLVGRRDVVKEGSVKKQLGMCKAHAQ
jgi:hypothetical protein